MYKSLDTSIFLFKIIILKIPSWDFLDSILLPIWRLQWATYLTPILHSLQVAFERLLLNCNTKIMISS